jgi:hypothetical protein
MQNFLDALKVQRWDDHRYYHHSRINQSLHLLSALSFITAYFTIFRSPAASAEIGWLVAMVSRQAGHFFFEPKGYDEVNRATHEHKEQIKVGYNLRRKVVLMLIWAISPAILWINPDAIRLLPRSDRAGCIHATRRGDMARHRPGWPGRFAPCICFFSRTCRRAWSGSPRSSRTHFMMYCFITERRCTCCGAS